MAELSVLKIQISRDEERIRTKETKGMQAHPKNDCQLRGLRTSKYLSCISLSFQQHSTQNNYFSWDLLYSKTFSRNRTVAVFILKTSLTNNLYGGLSSSGIKTGRVYQTSLEADEFKISDELNRRA